ncbi:hypothetical protein C0992_006658 [Termitomyces sp. T32_za158]|nr:hypothetical protein C0992_006658 [Termitomyces sp. T32_za158]
MQSSLWFLPELFTSPILPSYRCDVLEKVPTRFHHKESPGLFNVFQGHDPTVCVNVLNFFYQHGRGHEPSATLEWGEQVLKNRAYISGTYYYIGADQFLFFLSRLLQNSVEVHERLGPMFKERVMERFGTEGDSLSLAFRMIAATVVDSLVDERDFKSILSMQCEDGSWVVAGYGDMNYLQPSFEMTV